MTLTKTIGMAVCAMVILFCADNYAQVKGYNEKYSTDELKADLTMARDLFVRDHPMFFNDKAEFLAEYERQYNLIADSMRSIDFLKYLGPMLSRMRCGHSRIYANDTIINYLLNDGSLLPLYIVIVKDSLFVRANFSGDSSIIPGSHIISINDQLGLDIIETLKDNLPADGTNESYKYHNINLKFSTKYTQFIGDPGEYRLELIAPNRNDSYTAILRGINLTDFSARMNEYRSASGGTESFEMTFDDHNRYAILKIESFSFYGDELPNFKAPVDSFFIEVANRNIATVIIDVRGNDGGDPYAGNHLLQYIMTEPYEYFREENHGYDDLKTAQALHDNSFVGDLYILTDGGCFSTTGHFCSILKYHKRGIFVGEETGGSWACNDASQEHSLANTGIVINVPRATYATAVSALEKGRGIRPDYSLTATIDDLINRRDVVLQKAIDMASRAK